jgi:hypothetical protein
MMCIVLPVTMELVYSDLHRMLRCHIGDRYTVVDKQECKAVSLELVLSWYWNISSGDNYTTLDFIVTYGIQVP